MVLKRHLPPGAAPGRVPAAAAGDPGRVLRVPEAPAGLLQLPRYPRLRGHTLLPRAAAHRGQVHAAELS